LGRGGGPPSKGAPQSRGGPPSGGGPPRGHGGEFLIRGACVPFNAP